MNQNGSAQINNARSMMRRTICDIYAERFYCPNNVYCIVFGLMLIIISSMAITDEHNKHIMIWTIWNIIRGADSILGMVIHHLTVDSDLFLCKFIRRISEGFHIIVFTAGCALSGAGIFSYGFRHMPYICIFTIIVTVIDIIWIVYLLSQTQNNGNLRIPSRPVNGNIYTINSNVEYLSARPLQDPCIVCMDASEGLLLKLHCGHIYHVDCILPWLKTKGTCPLCRDNSSTERRSTSNSFLSLDRQTGYQTI